MPENELGAPKTIGMCPHGNFSSRCSECRGHQMLPEKERVERFRELLDTTGLDDGEYAEYRATQMFPFNEHGRELTKKVFLKTATPGERREWSHLKNEHFPLESDLIALEEGVENGDQHIKKVEMNECSSLSVQPGFDAVIFTRALAGCFGVAVYTEENDGVGLMTLSHYQPIKITENASALENFLSGQKICRNKESDRSGG